MACYSTDSDEHLINIGAIQDPEEAALMDWWFEESGYLYYSSEDEDKQCELDPAVEAHNDEVMKQDHITDILNTQGEGW